MGEVLAGRQAVREALKAGRPLHKILIAEGAKGGLLNEIQSLAKERGIPVLKVERRALNRLAEAIPHQGVVALAAAKEYVELEDLIRAAQDKEEPAFLVMLDGVEDPQNMGAILRLADACGVQGVIIPKRRSVGLSAAVARASAGALEYVPVARVNNLRQAVETLKEAGMWIIGAEGDGETLAFDADFTVPLVLILGGEGKGLSPLLRKHCDTVVRLPLLGHVTSLNVATAAAVLFYEVVRQRRFLKGNFSSLA